MKEHNTVELLEYLVNRGAYFITFMNKNLVHKHKDFSKCKNIQEKEKAPPPPQKKEKKWKGSDIIVFGKFSYINLFRFIGN